MVHHATPDYPENPVLVRIRRGDAVESQHRGAWVLTDSSGKVLEGMGEFSRPVFVRSSVKSLQALPLLETGAAERFGFSDVEIALALSSHNAEARQTDAVAGLLARLGLAESDLQCGAEAPRDPESSARLRAGAGKPSAIHNNCSGKHAGFLALALHLGVPKERYLDPSSAGQTLVREAVLAMSGVEEADLTTAVDGCSAPTFRMPLTGLATAFARLTSPGGLERPRREACERMIASVAAHPEMIAGAHKRICTEIARVTRGRIFPKIGGDAVYGIGICGADRGLAIKIDDGSNRGLQPLVVALLSRFGFLSSSEVGALAPWRQETIRNWAGLATGSTEVLV
ncbi:MAG: asparaginase [Planctomycetota bacterium]